MIMSSGPFTAFIDDASLSAQPATPSPATPAPTYVPGPTPGPSPASTPPPTSGTTPAPGPETPGPTVTPTQEPDVFSVLTNGGFEIARADGTAYGWHKIGGEAATTTAYRREGDRALEIVSQTPSTKWAFQTVLVMPGAWYEASAWARAEDPGSELLVRLSWYRSADGSGQAISSADSAVVIGGEGFTRLSTGPAQAPPDALTVKLRLLFRPNSPSTSRAFFDAASLSDSAPGAAETAAAPTRAAPARRSGPSRGSAVVAAAGPESVTSAGGPLAGRVNTDLANVRGPDGVPAPSAAPSHGPGNTSPWEVLALIAVLGSLAGIAAVFARELTRQDTE
jgi:hypothetical protein